MLGKGIGVLRTCDCERFRGVFISGRPHGPNRNELLTKPSLDICKPSIDGTHHQQLMLQWLVGRVVARLENNSRMVCTTPEQLPRG